jgi:hypothetical protein
MGLLSLQKVEIQFLQLSVIMTVPVLFPAQSKYMEEKSWCLQA